MQPKVMLGACLILSLLFCGIVGYQNHLLARELSVVNGGLSGTANLQPGDLVPPFEAKEAAGGIKTVRFGTSTRPTVIFIFSTGCRVSVLQIKKWWTKLAQENSAHADFVAMSLEDVDPTRAALEKLNQRMDFLAIPSPRIQRAYRVTAVPELLIVSPEGVVEWVHYGLLRPGDYQDLVGALRHRQGTDLPQGSATEKEKRDEL